MDMIFKELRNAEDKYSWDNITLYMKGCILGEEVGEVIQAINEHDDGNDMREQIFTEAAQVAAVAYRIMDTINEHMPRMQIRRCRECGNELVEMYKQRTDEVHDGDIQDTD